MKSVMCMMPDQTELDLSERTVDSFILDPGTYYYFRDQVFIKGITNYIKQRYPNEIPPGKIVNGFYHSPPKRIGGVVQMSITPPADSPAAKAAEKLDTQEVIARHYKEWCRHEPKYYIYNNRAYSFVFHGFFNVGSEIEVLLWETEELAAYQDDAYRHPIRWALKRIFKYI